MGRAVFLVAVLLLGAALASVVAERMGLALAFTALAGLAALAPLAARRERPVAAPAPVAVPPEEVELEEGPVACCLRCGSIDVRQSRLSEGHIPGSGAQFSWICGRCKHRGQPLEFDDATAYRQFIKGLNEEEAGEAR